MLVEAQLPVAGTRAAVWAAIADIEGAARIISGIKQIEIVERPASGLVGLRWRETRILFGEPATVEKWVTAASENEYYTTRAEEKGFAFLTTMRITEGAGGVTVVSSHDSQPQTFSARLQAVFMGLFFKGVIRKAILQDLGDIKAAVEGR
ncbi:SRPBCC family protein [Pseudoduganella sp. OTU4001]|uniref:SRPBCC family protein n=1 Tax=Pseudoduganella sp. OTU4001 TaxID=3043854 RepID=UPI00313D557A